MGANAVRNPTVKASQFDGPALTDTGLDLRVRRPMQPVDIEAVGRLPSLGAACAHCASRAGLQDKSIAIECEVDPAQWARIKSGDANPSGEFLNRLMDTCGNEAPLVWLLLRRHYDPRSLHKLRNELELTIERQAARIAELEAQERYVQRLMRGAMVGQAT